MPNTTPKKSKKKKKLSPVKVRAKAKSAERKRRPKDEPNPYRSGFEQHFMVNMDARGWGLAYEPIRLPFVEPAKQRHYVPDFVFDPKTKRQVPKINDVSELNGKIILELKGVLDSATRSKMKRVRAAYPDLDIRFVFMADNWVTKAKKQRYSQWAEANGFKWWVGTCPPEEWFK